MVLSFPAVKSYLKPDAGTFEFHGGVKMNGVVKKNNFIVTTEADEKFQFYSKTNFSFTVSQLECQTDRSIQA